MTSGNTATGIHGFSSSCDLSNSSTRPQNTEVLDVQGRNNEANTSVNISSSSKSSGTSTKPVKPTRITKAKRKLDTMAEIADIIINKSISETPLSVALKHFNEFHAPDLLSFSERFGFKHYLGKGCNAQIFNDCNAADQEEIIDEFVEEESKTYFLQYQPFKR